MTSYNHLYKDPNYNVENIPCFNNTDGYNELSMYLDFACKTTIQKQNPYVDFESEKNYAKELLTKYMNGDKFVFTRQFGIRENINRIGKDKVRGILLANMIEREAYNQGRLHKLVYEDAEYSNQCAGYITYIAANETLNEQNNYDWVTNNMETLIDSYVEMKYDQGQETRSAYEYYTLKSRMTEKAMEKLNLQMRLKSFKK